MYTCGGCARHVRETESVCPFCGEVLATTTAPSPARVSSMILSAGLTLLACTPSTGDESAEVSTTTMMGSATETDGGTTFMTTGDGDGDVSTTDETERGAEAYAAPEFACADWLIADVDVGDNPVATGVGVGWTSQSCGGANTPSVYAFTAGPAGDYEFAVIDADFSPVVSLIGYLCDPPDEFACALAPETITYALDAGQTVHIAVDSVEVDTMGSATLTIAPPAP